MGYYFYVISEEAKVQKSSSKATQLVKAERRGSLMTCLTLKQRLHQPGRDYLRERVRGILCHMQGSEGKNKD